MKPLLLFLIDVIFRVIITLTICIIAQFGLILLALVMWDGEYMDMACKIQDKVWTGVWKRKD